MLLLEEDYPVEDVFFFNILFKLVFSLATPPVGPSPTDLE
jgi:hypothetical protein